MKFSALASGSTGNLYTLEDAETRIIIECGLPYKQIQKLLPLPQLTTQPASSRTATPTTATPHKNFSGAAFPSTAATQLPSRLVETRLD